MTVGAHCVYRVRLKRPSAWFTPSGVPKRLRQLHPFGCSAAASWVNSLLFDRDLTRFAILDEGVVPKSVSSTYFRAFG